MACLSMISGPGHVSFPTHLARCLGGHACLYKARNGCWLHNDEAEVSSARDATASASRVSEAVVPPGAEC